MTKRYFAAALRGWIQIRAALRPPTAQTIVHYKDVMRQKVSVKVTVDHPWGEYIVEQVPSKLKMEQTLIHGGITVATVKAVSFAKRTGITLREGAIVELQPEQVKELRND